MSYTTNITKARVACKGFYLENEAYASLRAVQTVKIYPGPMAASSVQGTIKPVNSGRQALVICHPLFGGGLMQTNALSLPLKLDDKLEYEIQSGCIHLLAIQRQGTPSRPQSPTTTLADPAGGGPISPVSSDSKTYQPPCTDEDFCNRLACRFIEYLRQRQNARVDLTNEPDWFEGAFTASAGAGNPKGSVLIINPKSKDQIRIIITLFLRSLVNEASCGQSRFEWLFSRTVHQIEDTISVHSPETWFSFGRAQKILNIFIKYCYVWRLCKGSQSPKFGDLFWIDKWRQYLHVPVDRKTMEHLDTHQNYRDLAHESGQGKLLSWKWRMSEYNYCGIQDAIRKLANNAKLDPICYEMKYIWRV